ncbi:MAG: diphthine--ammonia ligase [Pyrinomonadaceae bacterium]
MGVIGEIGTLPGNVSGVGGTSVLMSWSGGKDSCIALYEIQRAENYRVAALLTTLTRDYDRISIHGVRRLLLEKQASSLGLPLHKVFISKNATNDEYEMRMGEAFAMYRDLGANSIVFGDLFLEEIRAYREQFLARHGMRGVFPVWRRNTSGFIKQFVELGFKAVVTCVDSKALDQSFAGKIIDKAFLSSLPSHVDPCGENGEFHSFVFDGPIFAEAVKFSIGESVLREGFWFRDLLPE